LALKCLPNDFRLKVEIADQRICSCCAQKNPSRPDIYKDRVATVISSRKARNLSSYLAENARSLAEARDARSVICAWRHRLYTSDGLHL